MKSPINKIAFWPSIAVLISIFGVASFGQSPPLLQDIKIHKEPSGPSAASTPLVKKTGSVTTAAAVNTVAVKTSIPVLAEAAIPGYSGVLVETLDGNVVVESGSNYAFNPASNVKIATAFAVLKTFGPDYRFPTNVWTDGSYEQSTGTIHGNVYISGQDPMFGFEHAVTIASELNRMGIKTINGGPDRNR